MQGGNSSFPETFPNENEHKSIYIVEKHIIVSQNNVLKVYNTIFQQINSSNLNTKIIFIS